MKLRNKKTGEIAQLSVKCENGGDLRTFDLNTNTDKPITLAELNEDWEDYEEPKVFYVVDLDGEILPSDFEDKTIEKSKEMGNYFKTREEAEKAVEMLKAWKRLKDAGFRITGWDNSIGDDYYKPSQIVIRMNNEPSFDEYDDIEPFRKDLDLLFGGEE